MLDTARVFAAEDEKAKKRKSGLALLGLTPNPKKSQKLTLKLKCRKITLWTFRNFFSFKFFCSARGRGRGNPPGGEGVLFFLLTNFRKGGGGSPMRGGGV